MRSQLWWASASVGLALLVAAGASSGFLLALGLVLLVGLLPWPGRRRLRINAFVRGGALVALTLLATGCGPTDGAGGSGGDPEPESSSPLAAATTAAATPTAGSSASSPPSGGKAVPSAPSTTRPTQAAPPKPPASLRVQPHGIVLPDRQQTPGAVTASATRARVCHSGYSASVRHVTETTRRAVFAAYGIPWSQRSHYEVDHLIPLELGGSNAMKNLWPEPQGKPGNGYASKDRLENHLHALVCAGQLRLNTAQHAIDSNWGTAYQRYRNLPVHHSQSTPPKPKPLAKPVAPGGGATAQCNDGSYSYAQHHQGACSHHGGVRVFYK